MKNGRCTFIDLRIKSGSKSILGEEVKGLPFGESRPQLFEI